MSVVLDARTFPLGADPGFARGAETPAYGGGGSNFRSIQGATGDQNIDGLLGGSKWGSQNLSYSFPTLSSQYEPGYSEASDSFSVATLAVQTATRFALNLVAQYTNMVVSEVNPASTSADIRIAFSASANPTAYAYYPSDGTKGGDLWLGTGYTEYQNPIKGQYAWHTMLHELGHALGLKHGHETDGVSGVAMDTAHDQMPYSVMTYRSFEGGPLTGYSNELNGYAQTYMIYDIAALQTMYGANFNTNSGNTTYSWNATTGEMSINGVGQGAPGGNRILMSLWDGNGVDTYDFSNYTTGLNIDLSPGGASITSAVQTANLGSGHFAPGNIFNALLFNGDLRSLIENAIGGSGADTILGNVADNRIQGGGGADTMSGGAGNDTCMLDADNANDTFDGGSGTADVVDLFNATSGVSVTFSGIGAGSLNGGGLGSDSFTNVERIYGSTFADVIYGGAGNDYLYGRAGDDTFKDGAGTDLVYGGEGNDRLYLLADGQADYFNGESGVADVLDLYYATSGVNVTFSGIGAGALSGGGLGADKFTNVERIYGSTFADVIYGGAGNDYLSGRAGDDTFKDGAGTDLVYGGEGNDRLFLSADGQADYFNGEGGTADVLDLYYATSGVNLYSSGAGTGTLSGGGLGSDSFSNVERIHGSNFADVIYGGAGNDYLSGRAGDDTFKDGAGTDLVYGGEGNDRLFLSADGQADYFNGESGVADVVDLYYATSGVNVTFSGIGAGSLSGGGLGADSFTNVERIYGSTFADVITGGAGDDYFYAREGNDTLRGGKGADTLWGVGGNDTFQFNSVDFQAGVNDRIADFHRTSGDTDTLRLQGSASLYSFSNSGANVIVTQLATGGTITIDSMTTSQLSGHILFF